MICILFITVSTGIVLVKKLSYVLHGSTGNLFLAPVVFLLFETLTQTRLNQSQVFHTLGCPT